MKTNWLTVGITLVGMLALVGCAETLDQVPNERRTTLDSVSDQTSDPTSLLIDTDPPDPDDLGPRCQLGTGNTSFEELSDNDVLEIVEGLQGGYHVWASVRTWGIIPGDMASLDDAPTLTFELRAVNGGIVSDDFSFPGVLRESDEGFAEFSGHTLVFFEVPDLDQEYLMSITIVAADGVVVEDERRVGLTW